MSSRGPDAPEAIVPFALNKTKSTASDLDPLDAAGQAILALVDRAAGEAEAADINAQQAVKLANEVVAQLRDAENRIKELEANVRYHEQRADRAEKWLRKISVEIKQSFFRTDGMSAAKDAPNRAVRRSIAFQPGIEATPPAAKSFKRDGQNGIIEIAPEFLSEPKRA